MADGSVRFVGDPGTTCDEALNYTVTDNEGNEVATSILGPDFVVSGIPEDQLKRWLLNQNFVADSSAAESAAEDLANEVATRINGQVVDQEVAEARLESEEAEDKPLEEQSQDELRDTADAEGVEFNRSDKRQALISKIEEARASAGDSSAGGAGTPQPPPPGGTITEQGTGETVSEGEAREENN